MSVYNRKFGLKDSSLEQTLSLALTELSIIYTEKQKQKPTDTNVKQIIQNILRLLINASEM